MEMSYKPDWRTARRRYERFWNRDGLVVGMWGAPEAAVPHETVIAPPTPADRFVANTDAASRALRKHHWMSTHVYPHDIIPLAFCDLGPGSLATLLGARPDFQQQTVWFHPIWAGDDDPTARPPLAFDADHPWWRIHEDLIRALCQHAKDKYIVGCPDLIEGLDVLASLRDVNDLMIDILERPAWVDRKLEEITQVWLDAYGRIYDLIKDENGWSAFGAFYAWGPGRTAKLQCDSSAMVSTEMFARFVTPYLTQQCRYLDHSLYHLDGTQAVQHLDALLAIDELDAIEWTPQAGIEAGHHERWWPMYRRILAAGKCVQVICSDPADLVPLLNAIGTKGVYALVQFKSEAEVTATMDRVATIER
jgi:hypothetical protein